MSLYLDCNATTPIEPRVLEAMIACFQQNYGNVGSPHEHGQRAKQAVHGARNQIAAVVAARRHEVIFTSGATESNNLALLGLAAHGEKTSKKHIVSTQIEHSAVLEPLAVLRRRGFEVTQVAPQSSGAVDAEEVLHALRNDTLLVSVMQVNNETGVCQPIDEIAAGLQDSECLFHVDAAQGFGKQLEPLRHQRIDLISVSGHKIHGPQGIGALITRRRQSQLPPLTPLHFGGGQELELRPGTLPVPLIVGLGLAAELAESESSLRNEHNRQLRNYLLQGIHSLSPQIHGDSLLTLPHTLNVSFPSFDADEVIQALWDVAAVSDGSACTSVCATASHVLAAMRVPQPALDGAVRISWSHLTPPEQFRLAVKEMALRLFKHGNK